MISQINIIDNYLF